jgi:voltage-gated potassium channel Kch
MDKPSWTDRLRYAFDNVMSKGTVALIGWLAVISLVVILVVSLVVWFTGVTYEASLVEQLWAYLLHGLGGYDPMSGVPWSLRLATLLVTFTGIFVMSTLIGVLTTGLEARLEELRKGRSRVVETGHTVILGWSPQVFPIISELVIANANRSRSTIVVLGDRDKVEMEDEVRDKVGDTGRTRVVCRRGSVVEMADLDIVSLPTARSIIILGPEGGDPDASVVKTLLAITRSPRRRTRSYHIVAELNDPENVEVARIVGRDEVEVVLTGTLIARITAQTSRQSGLSVVYTELLDFAGDEIYLKAEPALIGKTFGEALLAYEDAAVIGLCPGGGSPKLNPPMDTQIQVGDRIVAIAEDDDRIRLSGLTDPEIDEAAIRVARPVQLTPQQVLILGWNCRTPLVINELDQYVPPGSTITVIADVADAQDDIARRCAGAEAMKNQTVVFRQGNTTSRRELEELPFGTIDHVIVVPYSDQLDPQGADARTLVTLLHLRDIAEHGGYTYSVVSEMLDMRNRELAEVARADDFVVSDRLTSLTLAQISEDKALGAVFEDLFDPAGAEIYLKPAEDYVATAEPVNFYTVVESARRRGEVALGYRRHADAGDAAKAYGVVLNPNKSLPITFAEKDRVIVLAER